MWRWGVRVVEDVWCDSVAKVVEMNVVVMANVV